ncbi:MAG: hypothetical protein ACD_25C00260G0008 [uncultured bacterium]|uniref:Uncharacterized protein n=1 Tax=candidate division WWE3 bacterium TaxID=2053526 RepID=A0A656PLN4_UNCKA|nr:hypothetical protein P147_WWE3C00001G0101 [candidate division WWE3 bacterium RAAC2_WWE3_1]EKD94694.1 MAG: hypothetical protein ACD_25C00260G0008 [uncultured bacterium]KKS30160.1 MAG: hypothetical protein UU91_C0001G0050 [candidate division WWE3 bacterium GW2011_GWB1_42_117]KKS55209.1 MAG: hypothetical protein UV21_C0002G0083 [candidate division WWE3 bacterium GW2011_GWD2_42_34]KKT05760.1 MAG: hypothetical protein UV83_C0001G0078 [candidate division WWE3 bacterium GW2011_GWE2_43_18]KKT07350.
MHISDPMVTLRTKPVNTTVFVSPGAFIKSGGRLYINLNSYVNPERDQERYFTVQVTRMKRGVLVNVSTLPKDFSAVSINNKTLVDAHLDPVINDELELADAN